MSQSPNGNLTLTGAAVAMARAATALDRESADRQLALMELQRDRPELFPNGVWHSVKYEDGSSWSWKVYPSGRRGESHPGPPDEGAAGTVVTLDDPRPLSSRFIVLANELIADPRTAAIDRALLEDALRAVADDWSRTVAADSLAPMREALKSKSFDYQGTLRAFQGISRRVTELRRNCGINLTGAVGIYWTIALTFRMVNDPTVRSEDTARVILSVLGGDESDPMAILGGVCSRLIDAGRWAIIEAEAEYAREQGSRLTEEALDSETLHTHLSQLYGALPPAFAALALYRFLANNGPPDRAGRWRKLRTLLDEKVVRMTHAIHRQMLDLNGGDEWDRHVAALAQAKAHRGADEAASLLHEFIEVDLYYPRALTLELAGQAGLLSRLG